MLRRSLSILLLALISFSGTTAEAASHEELQAENAALKEALAMVTMNQAKSLGPLLYRYHDKAGAFPEKPSDLRELIAGSNGELSELIFIAPYAVAQGVEFPKPPVDPAQFWSWLDENSSYEFLKVDEDDDPSTTALVQERDPILPDRRVVVFVDGHVELVQR